MKTTNIDGREVVLYDLPRFFNWMAFAVTWKGKIYLKKGYHAGSATIRHEMIHAEQQKELGMFKFLILYGFSWLWNVVRFKKECYRNIVFEREAMGNAVKEGYLNTRKQKAWKAFWVLMLFIATSCASTKSIVKEDIKIDSTRINKRIEVDTTKTQISTTERLLNIITSIDKSVITITKYSPPDSAGKQAKIEDIVIRVDKEVKEEKKAENIREIKQDNAIVIEQRDTTIVRKDVESRIEKKSWIESVKGLIIAITFLLIIIIFVWLWKKF